jgi:hypothetical protein
LVDHNDVSVLKVAHARFYVWPHWPVSAGKVDNQRLLELIRDSYALSSGVYGYRRVHCDLREIGEQQEPGSQDHETSSVEFLNSIKGTTMPHVQDLGITIRIGIPGPFNTITVVRVGSIGVRTGERQLNLLWAGTTVPLFCRRTCTEYQRRCSRFGMEP